MSNSGPVLLVGSAGDEHVAAVKRRLDEMGVESVVFDTLAFPDEARVAVRARMDAVTLDGRPLARPSAVYLRNLHSHPLAFGVDAREAMEDDWYATLVTFREKATLIAGLLARWEAMGVPVYNGLGCEWREHKPFQLAALDAAGLPVPDTLWSNDPAAVRAFAAGRRVAYKPVTGGAATRELSDIDLSDERLSALASAPVTFQELLPGEDIRVYVLDGRVVCALRIVTGAIDFRQNEERIDIIPLAPDIERMCIRAAEVIGLRWTGMDLKRADNGQLKFLELNSSPMFLGFDARSGSDILGALCDTLARTPR